jgi:uncharacterized protein
VNNLLVGPVQPEERIQTLDILRGFALLGILQVNWENTTGWLSDLVTFFAEGSFYTSFSFLFGLGFALQMIRAEEAGRAFVVRYLWRTLILLAIGAFHFIFIWGGDILRDYALIAPILLVVRRLRPAMVLALATGVLVLTMAPELPSKGHLTIRVNPERVESRRVADQLNNARRTASPPAWCEELPGLGRAYRGQVCQAAGFLPFQIRGLFTDLSWSQGWYTSILAMFLLGMYVGRRQILRHPSGHTRLLSWVAGVCLVLGVAFSALFTYGEFFEERGVALPEAVAEWVSDYYIGNIGLALFYLSTLTLLVTHSRLAARLLAPLGKIGRMGLTNYLLQSIVFMLILGPVGFGVTDLVTGGYSLLMINGFFVLQIFFSYWWLRRFRFGPAEWAWRSLTWLRLQPMRLSPQPVYEAVV